MATSSPSIRAWRTAFLTLRDETLTPPIRTSLPNLLHTLILSHSVDLIAAAPDLPAHEVTSDVLLLLELAKNAPHPYEDMLNSFTQICNLIHGICQHVPLQLNAASWDLMLGAYYKMVGLLLGKPPTRKCSGPSAASAQATIHCLETLRKLVKAPPGHRSISEETQLIRFLLHIIECCKAVMSCSSHANVIPKNTMNINSNFSGHSSLWEIKTFACTMIEESFSRVGSFSIAYDVWQPTLEVLRTLIDGATSKRPVIEDSIMSKFYISVLNCLHLVLADPKGSLSDQVAGLVAALRLFLTYGLTNAKIPAHLVPVNSDRKCGPSKPISSLGESEKTGRSPYRPPHLRKKDFITIKQSNDSDYQSTSDQEYSLLDSSDSDCSDSDGSVRDTGSIQSSKARIAAIMCIQDLCQADSKLFSAQWTLLLPTNENFQSRKHEANLMTCLLYDPSLKARLASASALSTMLDGPASVFLQVAEHKEATKSGSFTALSTSLGLILMQLHRGVLYLIERETHGRLLASIFRILLLLIQSTPYSRMPSDLLPNVIASLRLKIEQGFPFKYDQTGLQVAAFTCLAAALSTSPSSLQVNRALSEELSTGSQGILHTIFWNCQRETNLTLSFEAFQVLRSVAHNYPEIMMACWDRVSTTVYGFLRSGSAEISPRYWKGHEGTSAGIHGEKFLTAVIKVLDECLRAISGFKGTEDQLDDKLLDIPFISDCLRTKKISSAPLYGLEKAEHIEQDSVEPGSKQWFETIERHMPLIILHNSAMVRAASLTCFAGITSSVFFSLTKEKQDYIILTLINAAEQIEAPSVRCAACRAIGVISCFPQIFQSAEVVKKFTHAAANNSKDSLGSVRIASSWALANICDSLRYFVSSVCNSGRSSDEVDQVSDLMASTVECALRLTRDGDKVKANAVRALGNLLKWVQCSTPQNCPEKLDEFVSSVSSVSLSVGDERLLSGSHQRAFIIDPHWLEKLVQAFVSCVTTGNVKVQWNVCHALSNLFLNKSLKLHDMNWAPSVFSILMILLRDSSNFKIRIQAAAALAVPKTLNDYGRSFADIVQGLEHVIENFGSDQIQTPSIKYKIALENQLTSTMLHVLSMASCADNHDLKDFFLKKASFFEEWLKMLCKSLGQPRLEPHDEINAFSERKKEMISEAVRSLVELYEDLNREATAKRFKLLIESIS
uniref:DUF4042 domain-containing protein n=1 Tax=Kalanchoe fedtschenkoi TaxID=63787 RepID=A0A7N1A0M5_KALFE